ncbi:MAG: hypothetical protein LBM93_07960 [Oscillospiraceae bacterium]|nr:hypothetical protein [Oscillospiraceae bacterium]
MGLYERDTAEKDKLKVKGLTDFNYAVVREITAKGVKLDILLYPKTHYKRVKEILAVPKEQMKKLYAGNVPKLRTGIDSKNFCWNDLGIEYMLFEEKHFIVPLQLDDYVQFDIGKEGFMDFYEEYKHAVYYDEEPEKFEKMQEDFENYSNEEWVNEADHIYWFLKEENINFNETRFKNRYFKKGYTPLFDRVSA